MILDDSFADPSLSYLYPPISYVILRMSGMSGIDFDHYSWEEVYSLLGCKYLDDKIDDDSE
jgi:hypothetical protein